jgi:aldose 1-epimerase
MKQASSATAGATAKATIERAMWGTLRDGRHAEIFTLANERVRVRLTNFGGHLVSIETPDAQGRMGDVLLGYDTLSGYEDDRNYLGATVGRLANRLNNGRFLLDDREYTVPINNPPNALHGGPEGFHRRLWQAHVLPECIELAYTSPDGEMGFPGTLRARVQIALQDDSLRLDFLATTDKPTPVCMTNHAYFNLTGDARNDVLRHEVTVHAERFLPVSETLIPTGEMRSVAGTPFDFRSSHAIGARIAATDEQLQRARGYDHTFALERGPLRAAADVFDPFSGRTLRVETTEPGVQFYSGNFLDGSEGKGGVRYKPRTGFCLETQHFPDSPNHPDFPSVLLRPGEKLHSTTTFTFGLRP